jgi:YggT family protein
MPVIQDLLRAVIEPLGIIIHYVLGAYVWVLIIRAVISWVSPDPYNPIVRALYSITEPVLSFLRRRFPLMAGSIDFSPMVAILIVWFLQMVLDRLFLSISNWLSYVAR